MQSRRNLMFSIQEKGWSIKKKEKKKRFYLGVISLEIERRTN